MNCGRDTIQRSKKYVQTLIKDKEDNIGKSKELWKYRKTKRALEIINKLGLPDNSQQIYASIRNKIWIFLLGQLQVLLKNILRIL